MRHVPSALVLSLRLTFPTAALVTLPSFLYASDPMFILKTPFEAIEKGGVAVFTLECVTDSPLTDLNVSPSLTKGFRIESAPTIPSEVPTGKSMYQYLVRAPFYWFSLDPELRNLPTGIKPEFGFNITYRKDGQLRTTYLERTLTFTTHKLIYFIAGGLGLVVGFVVKSLLTWQGLPAKHPKLKFLTFLRQHLSNFAIVLVLGFVGLVALQAASAVLPADSFEKALVLGFGFGILGDETLLQKVQGKITV